VGQPWQVDFGDGPTAGILPPLRTDWDTLDDTSLIVRLTWQEAIFLFTGDLEADGLLELHRAGWPLTCAVLKVPHHGGDEAVSSKLLAVTSPDLAVISVGADNRFGHPAKETLSCLDQANVRVLRTDRRGSVHIVTDGDRVWVQD
jgi:competence protein ComEC